MTTALVDARSVRTDVLQRRVKLELEAGRDVVLTLGDRANPERVLKIIAFLKGGYEVELVVRHAELREYIEHAVAGSAIGAGVGAGGAVLTALAYGNPITLGPVLVAAGIGAVVGAIVGAGVTPLHRVTVYKHNGETRLKISPQS